MHPRSSLSADQLAAAVGPSLGGRRDRPDRRRRSCVGGLRGACRPRRRALHSHDHRGEEVRAASLTVPVGATVVWDNASTRRHAITTDPARFENEVGVVVPDDAEPFMSIDLVTGQSWKRTFTVPGTYVYACPYHVDDGMIGMIVVEG